MSLTNTELQYYDSNILRLPKDKRDLYNAQVDRLVANLTSKLHQNTSFRISRALKAGSFAKYTILRKTTEDPVDVDVVFYLRDHSATEETYASLSDEIYNFLIAVYPTKSVEDFKIGRRTATVTFIGSGIAVDIVPVVEIQNQPGYGWQFDQDGTKTLTCAPGQIKFVRDRKTKDADFRTLVRLAKRWRNYKKEELGALKSYTIELIMGFLLDRDGRVGSVEQRFRNFLLYIAQSELKEKISFSENTLPLGNFSDPVIILDPVNSQNNVAARIQESERLSIVQTAAVDWETIHFASAEDDIEVWKELFGPRFQVEENQ